MSPTGDTLLTQLPAAMQSLPEVIDAHARSRPLLPALITDAGTRTWAELAQRARAIAGALGAAGVARGDRVALVAGNSEWAWEAIFGVLRAEAVIAPLSPLMNAASLARMLDDCQPKVLLCATGVESLCADALEQASCGRSIRLITERAGFEPAPAPGDRISLSGTDTFSVIYSSGTTGTPKGIVHTHRARMQMGLHVGLDMRFDGASRALLATPPHTNGSYICLLPAVIAGGALVLLPRFEAGLFLAALEHHRPTHAFLVPTMLRQVVDHPSFDDADLSSLVTLVSAGSPMSDALKDVLRRALGNRFSELWGLTEGLASFIRGDEMEGHAGSVGRPLSGTDLVILGDDGRQVHGAVGEIVGRSPYLMDGYLNRPDATADATWTDPAGRVWLRTGDLGELTDDGYLLLKGRRKDLIISGGLNVYPLDLETELCRHSSVMEAVVIGVEHDKWGETPVGFVRLWPNTPAGVQPDALCAWVNERLARYQRLHHVVVVDDFPRNTLGKPLKNELRARHAER